VAQQFQDNLPLMFIGASFLAIAAMAAFAFILRDWVLPTPCRKPWPQLGGVLLAVSSADNQNYDLLLWVAGSPASSGRPRGPADQERPLAPARGLQRPRGARTFRRGAIRCR